MSSEFLLLPDEVYAIAHLGATTVWRLERDNRFPRRIKISNRKVAWRKADVLEWARDPEAWCRRTDGAKPIIDNAKQPLAAWDDA